MLQKAYNCNYKDDSLVFSKAAKIFKKIMINSKSCYFFPIFS